MINNIFAVYFSPTGNTAKIVKDVATTVGAELGHPIKVIDYTFYKIF